MVDEPSGYDNLEREPAGFVSRFVAFFIDRMIVASAYTIITTMIGVVFQSFRLSELLGIEDLAYRLIWMPLAAGGLLLDLAYHIGFWMLAGQTLGKAALGLVIIRVDGRPLGLWPALMRWLGYWLSGILFLGYLWILADDRRQAWHDKLASTMVVHQVRQRNYADLVRELWQDSRGAGTSRTSA